MSQKLGHYTIIKELGRGGMGVVYLARDTTLDRDVAIKVLSQPIADDDVMVQRFLREARSAAALTHPNIVQVYFIGKEGDKHFFVMEYVKGATLTELIEKERQMATEKTAQIILQAASGLAAAHDVGIIHRDIKPSNLILDENGLVKIADFGIAFKPEVGSKLTATGQFLGTPGYLCPEICLGEATDNRSDIFSLGIVFFEMLSGFSPFEADSPMAMMHKVVTAEVPDISLINTNVDHKLKLILKKMVAKDRADRYQDCHLLQKDLEDYLGIQRSQVGTSPYVSKQYAEKTVSMKKTMPPPVPVAPPAVPVAVSSVPPKPEHPKKQNSSGGVFAVLAAIICLLGMAGFAGWYFLIKEASPTPDTEWVGDSVAEDNSTTEGGHFEVPSEVPAEVSLDTQEITSDTQSDQEAFIATVSTDTEAHPAESKSASEERQETSVVASIKNENRSTGNIEASNSFRSEATHSEPEETLSRAKTNAEPLASTEPIEQHSSRMDPLPRNMPNWSGWSDLFRAEPVDLPQNPSVSIVVTGDMLLSEPLEEALAQLYQKRGYKVVHKAGQNSRDEMQSPETGMSQLLDQSPGISELDLLVWVRVQPVSKLGIEYGSNYRTMGYQVNTVSRIQASSFLPRQNRPGLTGWARTINYNVDTAESEAELLVADLADGWVDNAPKGLQSDKKKVLLYSQGDVVVGSSLIAKFEHALQTKGFQVLNLDAMGISANPENLNRLLLHHGAQVLLHLTNTFLSEEEVAAYGQVTVLSNHRITVEMSDLKVSSRIYKKSKNLKSSMMALDGDCELLVSEFLQPILQVLEE